MPYFGGMHSCTVESRDLLLVIPTFTTLQFFLNLLACSVWAMRCIAMLCLAICRPLMSWCAVGEKVWPCVSLLWHGVQLGLVWVSGHNMFLCGYPYIVRIIILVFR